MSAMPDEREILGYARLERGRRFFIPAAGLLMIAQVVWFVPTAFVAWVWLCQHGMVHTLAPNVACAVTVCLPSLAAVGWGFRTLRNSSKESAFTIVITILSMLAALAFVAYIWVATVGDLRRPLENSCFESGTRLKTAPRIGSVAVFEARGSVPCPVG